MTITRHILKGVGTGVYGAEYAWCLYCNEVVRKKKYRLTDGSYSTHCGGPAQVVRYPGQELVDAGPLRERISEWTSVFGWGLNFRDIADMMDIHVSTLRTAYRSTRVRGETLQRVMEFTPTWSSIGVRRRLRALMADGYTRQFIGEQLGMNDSYLSKMICDERLKSARGRTDAAEHVLALYDKFEDRDPSEFGIPIRVVRSNQTKHRHWARSGLWHTDIDRPGACPQYTGMCGTPDGYRLHSQLRIVIHEKTARGATVERYSCAACREAWRIYSAEKRAAVE